MAEVGRGGESELVAHFLDGHARLAKHGSRGLQAALLEVSARGGTHLADEEAVQVAGAQADLLGKVALREVVRPPVAVQDAESRHHAGVHTGHSSRLFAGRLYGLEVGEHPG